MAVILTLSMLLSLFPMSAMAAGNESEWSMDEAGIVCLYSGIDENVEVPATINGETVKGISASLFSYNGDIKTVTLPAGISIPGGAFAGCDSLTDVYLKGSYTITFGGDEYDSEGNVMGSRLCAFSGLKVKIHVTASAGVNEKVVSTDAWNHASQCGGSCNLTWYIVNEGSETEVKPKDPSVEESLRENSSLVEINESMTTIGSGEATIGFTACLLVKPTKSGFYQVRCLVESETSDGFNLTRVDDWTDNTTMVYQDTEGQYRITKLYYLEAGQSYWFVTHTPVSKSQFYVSKVSDWKVQDGGEQIQARESSEVYSSILVPGPTGGMRLFTSPVNALTLQTETSTFGWTQTLPESITTVLPVYKREQRLSK